MRLRLSLLCLAFATLASANLNVVSQENVQSAALPSNGAAVDEVVVESSLHIKPKLNLKVRRARSYDALVQHIRVKRAAIQRRNAQNLQPSDYAQSQAIANAAANNHFNNKLGSGASAANAQAQAFQVQGSAGGFGASSAGSVTQAQNANKFGVQNSAGASLSQSYTLPNGQTINFAGTNSFANGPNGNSANSRGGAVSVSNS